MGGRRVFHLTKAEWDWCSEDRERKRAELSAGKRFDDSDTPAKRETCIFYSHTASTGGCVCLFFCSTVVLCDS